MAFPSLLAMYCRLTSRGRLRQAEAETIHIPRALGFFGPVAYRIDADFKG